MEQISLTPEERHKAITDGARRWKDTPSASSSPIEMVDAISIEVAKAQLKKVADEGQSTGAFDKDRGIDVVKMYNLWQALLKEVG